MHAHRSRPQGGKTARGFAIAGGSVVILGLLAATLYVLVLRGTRIPLLYPAISHLAADGLSERDRAVKAVTQATSYQYASTSQIALKLKSGGATSLSGGAVAPVPTVTTTLQTAVASLPTEGLSAKTIVAGPGKLPVPLLFVSGDPNWKIRLPLDTTPTDQQVSAAAMRSSFLPAAILPIRLSTILKSATAVTSYGQETSGTQRLAVYGYSLDPKQIATALPNGVAASDASATVTYPWGSDRPAQAAVSMTLTDGSIAYSYASLLNYQNWDEPVLDADLSGLAKSSGTDLSVSDLIAHLGFAAGSLPGSDAVTAPAPVAALVPAAQFTTQLLPVITATPPPPASAITDAMTVNDTQRKADLKLLQLALERYSTDHAGYPKSDALEQVQSSQTLLSALVSKYLTALPIDPSRTVYWYEYQSDGKTYSLRSVAENPADPSAKLGTFYHYFEFTSSKP